MSCASEYETWMIFFRDVSEGGPMYSFGLISSQIELTDLKVQTKQEPRGYYQRFFEFSS